MAAAAAVEKNISKEGYLHRFTNRQGISGWQKLYYVLYKPTRKNEGRLDWHETQEAFIEKPAVRCGLFLEEITRIERLTIGPEEDALPSPVAAAAFAIRIHMTRTTEPQVLKCSNEEMLVEWLEALERTAAEAAKTRNVRSRNKKSKDDGLLYTPHQIPVRSYWEVELEQTASATRQNLKGIYKLVLSKRHINLINCDESVTVITWLYSQVRRFGLSNGTFMIEGGQRSEQGEGLFIFKNCDGRQLFEAVQERICQLKKSLCISQSFPPPSHKKPHQSEENGTVTLEIEPINLDASPATAINQNKNCKLNSEARKHYGNSTASGVDEATIEQSLRQHVQKEEEEEEEEENRKEKQDGENGGIVCRQAYTSASLRQPVLPSHFSNQRLLHEISMLAQRNVTGDVSRSHFGCGEEEGEEEGEGGGGRKKTETVEDNGNSFRNLRLPKCSRDPIKCETISSRDNKTLSRVKNERSFQINTSQRSPPTTPKTKNRTPSTIAPVTSLTATVKKESGPTNTKESVSPNSDKKRPPNPSTMIVNKQSNNTNAKNSISQSPTSVKNRTINAAKDSNPSVVTNKESSQNVHRNIVKYVNKAVMYGKESKMYENPSNPVADKILKLTSENLSSGSAESCRSVHETTQHKKETAPQKTCSALEDEEEKNDCDTSTKQSSVPLNFLAIQKMLEPHNSGTDLKNNSLSDTFSFPSSAKMVPEDQKVNTNSNRIIAENVVSGSGRPNADCVNLPDNLKNTNMNIALSADDKKCSKKQSNINKFSKELERKLLENSNEIEKSCSQQGVKVEMNKTRVVPKPPSMKPTNPPPSKRQTKEKPATPKKNKRCDATPVPPHDGNDMKVNTRNTEQVFKENDVKTTENQIKSKANCTDENGNAEENVVAAAEGSKSSPLNLHETFQTSALKLSEVLPHLSLQTQPVVNGYMQIDLKSSFDARTIPRRHKRSASSSNLYGEQLARQMELLNDDSLYAEINQIQH